MSDVTDLLGLPLLLAGQAQKHITHNEALLTLDAVVQLAVLDRHRTVPPAHSNAGDRHVVAAGASGAWAGAAGQIALRIDGTWQFYAPRAGWRAFVLSEMQEAVFDGSLWRGLDEGPARYSQLGVNTASDATNRLAVASEAVLLNHTGAGVQLKLNKAVSTDTASLLYQTDFAGRAEMGLAGSDDFAIKTSGDGSLWHTALSINAGSGVVDAPLGLCVAGSGVYARANVVGPVTRSADQPTGALLERGVGANGAYLRFADGTQICWRDDLSLAGVTTALGTGFVSPALEWTYPMAFAVGTVPVVTGSAAQAGAWLCVPTAGAVNAALQVAAFSALAGAVPVRVQAVGRWA